MQLISFAARNHRSLRNRVELDLARPQLTRLQPAPGAGWSEYLYPVAGVFGANASGKSALVDAIAYLHAAIRLSATEWQARPQMPWAPFALDEHASTSTSTYEIAFVHDVPDHGPTRLDYEIEVSARGVEYERLLALYGTRRERVFERIAGEEGAKVSLPRHFPQRAALQAITGRELVLARAALLDHPVLAPVARAICEGVDVVRVGDDQRELRVRGLIDAMAAGETDLDTVAAMLRVADIGIDSVGIREEELPPELRAFVEDFVALAKERVGGPGGRGPRPVITVEELDAIGRTLDFRHRGDKGGRPLNLAEESTGTIAWLALALPGLDALRRGGVLVVDELDAALHPYLVDALVGMFADPELNLSGAQLIFTGHGTHVLSPLSRASLAAEQVWLTEKGNDGVTELFSVADFPHRVGENIEKRYLDGRYGAVPSTAPTLVRSLLAAGAS